MPIERPRTRLVTPVLAVAALLAVLPMLFKGPSCGHDFDFHLLSWLEASTQFASGQYPHWAFTPAFNAGEPRFIFYPPLSWSVGGLLGMVLPWKLVPIAFTFLSLWASGLTMHRLASRYAAPGTALLAAALYLTNPYMLFTAYERTAYGELLAAAWLPLLFAAALRDRGGSAARAVLATAVPVALLWLTNAPAAVMAMYALAALTLARLAASLWYGAASRGHLSAAVREHPSTRPADETPRPNRLGMTMRADGASSVRGGRDEGETADAAQAVGAGVRTAAGTLLGLALTAFYLVPAAYQQRFVKIDMALIPGMNVTDHFLFHRMPGGTFDDRFHDAVVRSASIIALLLLAGIVTALIRNILSSRSASDSPTGRAAEESASRALLPVTLLTAMIAFLLTPPSLLLWTHLPKLEFLQFPWRLNALLAVTLALTAAIAFRRLMLRPVAAALGSMVLAAALILPAWHLFHQACFAEDSVAARVALFHSAAGTEATDEYTPLGADADLLPSNDPPYWLASPASANAPAPAPCDPHPGCAAPAHVTVNPGGPALLVLNLRQYPLWQFTLNGHSVAPMTPKRLDGLTTLPVPAGADTIEIRLQRTPDQMAGLLVSRLAAVLAAGLAAGLAASQRPRKRSADSLADSLRE